MKFQNKSKVVIYTGLILFLVSFTLPAYSVTHNFYGFQCAYITFGISFGGDIEGGFLSELLTRIHFFLLGLHNLILPLCIFLSDRIINGKSLWLLKLLFVSTLNVILFIFYNQFSDETRGEVLRIGYYVWVFSSLMILTPVVWQLLKYKSRYNTN